MYICPDKQTMSKLMNFIKFNKHQSYLFFTALLLFNDPLKSPPRLQSFMFLETASRY